MILTLVLCCPDVPFAHVAIGMSRMMFRSLDAFMTKQSDVTKGISVCMHGCIVFPQLSVNIQ